MNGKLNPFARATFPKTREQFVAEWRAVGVIETQAIAEFERATACEYWLNDEYQVGIDKNAQHGFPGFVVWCLSIKRRDKAHIHDWRDLQAIKTALLGPEVEAVELYPAESRLMDTANQYWLWAFMGGGATDHPPIFPVGFMAPRNIATPEEAIRVGAVQRPFAEAARS